MAEIRRYDKTTDADSGFREALCKIWLSSFADSPDYFNFFYERKIRTKQAEIFYAICDDKIVGAVYLLPATIHHASTAMQKAYYGYAFAILPEYRGKGIYPDFAKTFYQFADQQKAGIIICPDNEKLLRYYTRNGAIQNYFTQKVLFREAAFAEMISDSIVRNISAEESALYEQIRNHTFAHDDFLLWDSTAVKYALEENQYNGGFCKILEITGKQYLILGSKKGDGSILIGETTLPTSFLIRNGAKLSEKPLVTYGIQPSPRGLAGLLLD